LITHDEARPRPGDLCVLLTYRNAMCSVELALFRAGECHPVLRGGAMVTTSLGVWWARSADKKKRVRFGASLHNGRIAKADIFALADNPVAVKNLMLFATDTILRDCGECLAARNEPDTTLRYLTDEGAEPQ